MVEIGHKSKVLLVMKGQQLILLQFITRCIIVKLSSDLYLVIWVRIYEPILKEPPGTVDVPSVDKCHFFAFLDISLCLDHKALQVIIVVP